MLIFDALDDVMVYTLVITLDGDAHYLAHGFGVEDFVLGGEPRVIVRARAGRNRGKKEG